MTFDWNNANIEHLANHNVEDFEFEDLFFDPLKLKAAAYNKRTEKRYALIGETSEGRILYGVYTFREETIRAVTAFDANKIQKREYLAQKRKK